MIKKKQKKNKKEIKKSWIDRRKKWVIKQILINHKWEGRRYNTQKITKPLYRPLT